MENHDTIEEKELDELDNLDDDEDEWEDLKTYEQILREVPEGWGLVKVFNYNWQVLENVREWLVENCQGQYREVNWGGSCSYSTGVMFEQDMDLILFKLRWGC